MIRKFLKAITLTDIACALQFGLKAALKKQVTKNIEDIKRSPCFRRFFSIDDTKCIACRICMEVCPCEAIEIVDCKTYKFDKNRCAYCGLCQKSCPKQAITLKSKDDSE